jgi:hypothetical protein
MLAARLLAFAAGSRAAFTYSPTDPTARPSRRAWPRGVDLPLGADADLALSQVEKAILAWAEGPIQDDLCVLVLKPQ